MLGDLLLPIIPTSSTYSDETARLGAHEGRCQEVN